MLAKGIALYALPYIVGAIGSVAVSPLVLHEPGPAVQIVDRSLKSDRLPVHQQVLPSHRQREIECKYLPATVVLGRCFASNERPEGGALKEARLS